MNFNDEFVNCREKAVEGHRSPSRWRDFLKLPTHAKRLGVRQPSGAFGWNRERREIRERLQGKIFFRVLVYFAVVVSARLPKSFLDE